MVLRACLQMQSVVCRGNNVFSLRLGGLADGQQLGRQGQERGGKVRHLYISILDGLRTHTLACEMFELSKGRSHERGNVSKGSYTC